jgi:hypothetical protein
MAVATTREVAAAQAFLKYLHAKWQDHHLILAVVAWMRKESGHNIIGNNPLNLRPGTDDAKFRSGVRKTKNGNGYFSVYASVEAGMEAAAYRLLHGRGDPKGWRLIVNAAHLGDPIEFLNALALSHWAGNSHYGYDGRDARTNSVVNIYLGFTGLKLPPPKTKAPKPKPRIPALPTILQAPTLERPSFYLDGFAPARFYATRQRGPGRL